MPTYEYRCPDGHQFERFFRKMNDAAAELPCPECGKPAAKQLSGGAGLLFKGSGFYLTDYGKNAHRKAAESSASKSESSGGAEPKSEPKSESKPAESKITESKAAADKPPGKPAGGSGSTKAGD